MRYDVVLSWRQEQDGATVYSTTHGLQGGDIYDEDLYQEFCLTLLNCIQKFRV